MSFIGISARSITADFLRVLSINIEMYDNSPSGLELISAFVSEMMSSKYAGQRVIIRFIYKAI